MTRLHRVDPAKNDNPLAKCPLYATAGVVHNLSSIADQDTAKDKVSAPAKQPQARHVEWRSTNNQPISSAYQTIYGLGGGMRAQLHSWAVCQSRLIDHESNETTRAIATCMEGTRASRPAAATCQTLTCLLQTMRSADRVY